MGGYAWVTLATNDSYSLGALVLAHSLKKSRTAHKSVVLITPAVSQAMREQLQTVFDVVKVVDVLDSKDEAHLALMQRPELGITFTKIHCWRLVEFDKCVFLDADTLVVRNCDELFEREEFSAAPDVSWPDCFNSGVFVYKPSIETFNNLLQFAVEKGSFDGGDQGLLNQFFSDWAAEDIKKHLPFVYNLTSVAAYSYVPAFKHYGSETRIVHFIGAGKPWLQQLDPATRTITPTSGSEHLTPLLQQWWDLFCEKVHPNLDKHLESNNDGMSHPPVEAWTNSLPIALTDDSQTPRLIEPCTPYREKDDFRQSNLPYQPFHVTGSSGELLNVDFFLASVAHPTPPDITSEEQQRQQGDRPEEPNGKEYKHVQEAQGEPNNDSGSAESEDGRQAERPEVSTKTHQGFQTVDKTIECKAGGGEEPKQEGEDQLQSEKPEQTDQPEELPPSNDPFDFNSFFPDENCINNYLEQNVMTYQPYDNQQHRQHHENQHRDSHETSPHRSSSPNSPQHLNDSSNNIPQLQESPPSLPRFLTIPENDKRQSGNAETHLQAKQSASPPKGDSQQSEPPQKSREDEEHLCPQRELLEERRELTKSKSMPYLWYDVTQVPSPRSTWKSQPDVRVDPSRKYSMPKLKPILPRQNSLSKSVPSVVPKVTLYTEFLMSSEYRDPADLPKDKVGFVETLIHKKGHLRRSKSAADISDKFGPLPYISPEREEPAVLKKTPLRHLDNGLEDLSQCKRQLGNKPKTKGSVRRKENSHVLPALKPLVPPKEKNSSVMKKRKSKELSPEDGGREKILKREPKKVKERKRECKMRPRNVSGVTNGNNVDEILERLREFSKNYQHFFGEVAEARESRIKCKNATVQADEGEERGECDAMECFLRSRNSWKSSTSRGTQTSEEEKPERHGPDVESEFRHFRNYLKEKSKTSEKGLLSIQDLVPVPEEKGFPKGSKGSNEVSTNGDGLRRKRERGSHRKVESLHERVVEKKDGWSEGERESSSRGDEVAENREENGRRSEIRVPSEEKSISVETASGCLQGALGRDLEKRNEEVESSVSSGTSLTKESKPKSKPSSNSEESVSKYAVVVSEEKEMETRGGRSEVGGSSGGMEPSKGCGVTGDAESTESLKVEDGAGTESGRSSHLEKMTANENGWAAGFSKAVEPGDSSAEESHPRGRDKEIGKVSDAAGRGEAEAGTEESAAVVSGPEKASKEQKNRVREGETGEDGGGRDRRVSGEEGSEKVGERVKNLEEMLCVPDFETPRSSRVVVLGSTSVGKEGVEETLGKKEVAKSQGSEQSRSVPGKRGKRKSRGRKVGGSRVGNGKSPPNDSPDVTDAVGEESCFVSGKGCFPSPSDFRNGNALGESEEDLKSSSGIAGAIAQLSLEGGSGESPESAVAASAAHQEYLRRQNWETGNMDYMGRDSFDKIWSKICQTLEGKESEETGAAAVSLKPDQHPEPSTPSSSVSAQHPSAPETLVSLSTVLQKCPEFIETLPGEPAACPVDDDEIIFSKPDNRQSCLTNITEEEEVGTEGSAPGPKAGDAAKVKLSDILHPEASSGPKEPAQADCVVSPGKCESAGTGAEAKAPAQKTTEGKTAAQKIAEEKAPAPKTTEEKAPTQNVAEQKTVAQKTTEGKTAAQKTTEAKAPAQKTAEEKMVAQKIAEDKTAAQKTAEEKAPAQKATEDKTPAQKTAEGKAPAPKTTEEKAPAQKVAEQKTVAQKTLEEKAAAQKTTEDKTAAQKTLEEKAAAQKMAEAKVEESTKAASGGKSEKPQEKVEEVKGECKTVAICQPVVPPQVSASVGVNKDENSVGEKVEGCRTVAIPSPPIVLPGAPFAVLPEKAESKGRAEKPVNEKFEPIPLPPPESPKAADQGEEAAVKTSTPDSVKDEGKQKKGVFTKILEMVGVAPKEKTESETSKSVFYDAEGAAPSKEEAPKKENEPAVETQSPGTPAEPKEVSPPQADDAGKIAEGAKQPTGEIKKGEEEKGLSSSDGKETAVPPKVEQVGKTDTPSLVAAPAKQDGKSKHSGKKPARNAGSKESKKLSAESMETSPAKNKSSSPKLSLPQKPPETAVTMPTPPPQPDVPVRKNSDLLKVEETVLETPPVREPTKGRTEEAVKGKVLAEVEDIIGKAKSEVESRLEDRRSAEKESGEMSDLVNTLKMMVGSEEGAQSAEVEVEELKVTTEEERMRHKGEVVSSKLSDQILKAIPPPRRKAISEASGSTSAIPKPSPTPTPEEKSAPGETKAKTPKPSSIPVPPPRSRGKPTQTTPHKGKGKK